MFKSLRILCISGLLLAGLSAGAQDTYLMPSFGQGMIYFRGQAPAQGKLNICAVDNTLRFLDKSGKELVASNADNILKVQIDSVVFIRYQDVFYRMVPVTADMGVAVRRDVKILKDMKQAGYGTTSQTSSIRTYNTIYSDGAVYNLEEGKSYPCEVTETYWLYKGDAVFSLSKKNLRKLFPSKKDQIPDVPDSLDAALALLKLLSE